MNSKGGGGLFESLLSMKHFLIHLNCYVRGWILLLFVMFHDYVSFRILFYSERERM